MASNGTVERLAPNEHEAINRKVVIEFDFEGRAISAYEGDTIGSALAAAGVDIMSRSFKYHRPRGLLCVAGNCPNCLMTVNGIPNVRTCTMKVGAGMRVSRQNAWPSADHDAAAVLDKMDRLLPVGFYYKAFHRPKVLWEVMRPLIRRIAGLGSVDVTGDGGPKYRHSNMHTDVAVVGGGPAGMSAALAAADAGAEVMLIDDQPALGGHLLYAATSDDTAADLRRRVASHGGIQVLSGASAFGFYQDNLLGIHRGEEAIQLRAGQVVMATGAFEVPMQFKNNDLPGIMLASGALRLLRQFGVPPGKRAVIVTADDTGYSTASALLDAGIAVEAVVDTRPGPPMDEWADTLKERGIDMYHDLRVVSASGTKRVSRVTVAGSDFPERKINCDLVCMAGIRQAATGLLLQQLSGMPEYDAESAKTTPVQVAEGVSIVGDVAAVHESRTQVGESERPAAKKEFICICEDVSSKDIEVAVAEGFGDIQTLKRYTTATMGPCQGKMCHAAFVEATALRTGMSIAETGATTARPPAQGVPLGALAGPGHMPRKRTPLDGVHRAAGAEMVEVGPWLRAHNYGSPQDEALAVRERVGLIDVSTLGKLDVRGPDAGALLDRVYTHRFSNLREGRIRYGLLCGENGAIMDDGTVTRLADDHYFVTTTTGNVDAIEDWFNWWLAGTGMEVFVTNVTSSLAAINVAGPKARETLTKLTDVDLSTEALGYMRSVSGEVAGVPCLFLRIGFVGETGWELHFPSEYAEHLWAALMEAGSEFDIGPFGLEAQRVLRLEKGHIIVTQDTDAVTDPLDAGMRWAVRFDKPDFIGRAGLAANRARPSTEKLVGFVMRDGFVPEDGQSIVLDGKPVGRVTSSRMSPTLGRGFGLAWVDQSLASEGEEILIRSGGNDWPAVVTLEPVYDPDGEKLRA